MMTYMLKISACLALFYVVYLLLFRNTDRFQLNRAYLLGGLILSFVLPIIAIPSSTIDILTIAVEQVYTPGETLSETDVAVPTPVSLLSLIQILYAGGAAMALLITFASVLKSLRLCWNADRLVLGRYTVRINRNTLPFSFFGVLVLQSEDCNPMIIEHEMVHVRQCHWIDLVLVEIAAAILWFNPFIYLYRKSIAIQHEYIADRNVVANVPVDDYLHCIAKQLDNNLMSALVSRFNTRSIKQRIMMITSTRNYSAIRYTLVLPVVIVLTMAFATRESTPGLSMQKRELRSPVDVNKLSKAGGAGFGKRINPATNKESFHTGVDLVTAAGNSVYAPADGVVVETTTTGDRGKFIVVMHDKELSTSYSHLEKILVKKGDRVERGQLIGLVGSTGVSTGPHLHFEVLKSGKAVDPVPYLNMSND